MHSKKNKKMDNEKTNDKTFDINLNNSKKDIKKKN